MRDFDVNAVVGVAKCPQTQKLYGVRIQIEPGDKWTATWAFPLRPETVRREGFKENQFPPNLRYGAEYPGCPYCKKREDLAAISKPPAPKIPKISVTKPGCDDIGSILRQMEIKYSDYSSVGLNCDIFFYNCVTGDSVNANDLRRFVEKGGCLYASCYADTIMKQAFPGIFTTDHSGVVHHETITVEDRELREIVGPTIPVYFNTVWAKLYKAEGSTCILRSTQVGTYPVMVTLKYGQGTIFYTCFHNSAQASDKEKALLQLLVLRQLGSRENMSVPDAARAFGVDLDALRRQFVVM